MRTITISCPGCGSEFRAITIDEAERVLFHGCLKCQESGKKPMRPARRAPGGAAIEGPSSSPEMN